LQALLALGLDYRYGGNSPVTGFDCSGLVAHVYLEAWNIRLPRNTGAQSKAGMPVSLAELQAGDLVFYDTLKRPYSHVGIYLGDGKFVHSPKSGAQVRIESLKSTYWTQRYNGARRIDAQVGRAGAHRVAEEHVLDAALQRRASRRALPLRGRGGQ